MDEIESLADETLDSVCYRYYGNSDNLEAVIKANKHLAEFGVLLPRGTKVKMPPLATKSAINLVNLWD